jgi:ketosteroid isomerase-like protein
MPEEATTPDLIARTRHALEGFRDLDESLKYFAPDAVWEVPQLGSRFEGPAAIRGFLEDWFNAFKEFEMEIEDILDLGNGVVFVVARSVGVPVGSAGRTQLREVFGYVVLWENHAVARVTAYGDIDEARAAAERLAESRG